MRVIRKKVKVPLAEYVSGRWLLNVPEDQVIAQIKKHTDDMAVVKPGRKLGGPWIDDVASQRGEFCLCEACYRKYIRHESWWIARNYVPIWTPKFRIDCDGCGEFLLCTMFYPEEAPLSYGRLNRTEGAKTYATLSKSWGR